MKTKKILSFLAAAAISASAFAGLAVTASAADAVYAAWDFCTTDKPLDENDINVITRGLTGGEGLTTKPSISIANSGNTKLIRTGSNVSVSDFSFADITGATKNYSVADGTCYYGIKMSSAPVVTITSNISSNTAYESYDLVIVHANVDKTSAATLKITPSNGTETLSTATGAEAISVATTTLNGLTADSVNIQRKSTESALLYVGLKYNPKGSTDPVDPPTVPVESVSMELDLIIKKGSTTQAKVEVLPENATDKTVAYTSDNADVATVDETGTVTGVAEGTATITATANNGVNHSTTVKVIAPSTAPTLSGYDYTKIYNPTDDDVVSGNQGSDKLIYEFVEGADETAKALFADQTYGTTVSTNYSGGYSNFIYGPSTDRTNGTEAKLTNVSLKAGSYTLYYLGYNNDKKPVTITIGDKTYTAGAGVQFAGNGSRVLKTHKVDFQLDTDITNETIAFDTAQSWLPDMYAIAIVGNYAPTKVASTVEVSNVEVFNKADKTSEATVFNAEVNANDFVVKGLKFENNDKKTETTEIAQGSNAVFVVVYEGLAVENPTVTVLN